LAETTASRRVRSAWAVRYLRGDGDLRIGIFERDGHPRPFGASSKTSGVEFAQRLSQFGLRYLELAEQVFDRAARGRLDQPHVHVSRVHPVPEAENASMRKWQ
jgi:hypothetical protein